MMEMNDKGTIGAVCISPDKGTEKTNVHNVVFGDIRFMDHRWLLWRRTMPGSRP